MDTCVSGSTSVRADAGSQVTYQTPFFIFFAPVPPDGVWSFRCFRPDGNLQDARNFFLSAKKPSEVTYLFLNPPALCWLEWTIFWRKKLRACPSSPFVRSWKHFQGLFKEKSSSKHICANFRRASAKLHSIIAQSEELLKSVWESLSNILPHKLS